MARVKPADLEGPLLNGGTQVDFEKRDIAALHVLLEVQEGGTVRFPRLPSLHLRHGAILANSRLQLGWPVL